MTFSLPGGPLVFLARLIEKDVSTTKVASREIVAVYTRLSRAKKSLYKNRRFKDFP